MICWNYVRIYDDMIKIINNNRRLISIIEI